MISLVSIPKVIAVVAGLSAAIAVLLASVTSLTPVDAWKLSAIIEIVVLVFCIWGWRKLWQWVPKLNDWLFPDLNGTWRANIDWVWGDKHGVAEGLVHVNQNFFRLSLELETPKSESQTLSVAVKRDAESNRPMLHYIYRCSPNQSLLEAEPLFDGAAVLLVGLKNNSLLEGNYWTSRATRGHFTFRRVWPTP